MTSEARLRDVIGAKALRFGYIGVDRDNIVELCMEVLAGAERENERLRDALVEIDTYFANDPDVWRTVSVAKARDVLCDVLGAETVRRINAEARHRGSEGG